MIGGVCMVGRICMVGWVCLMGRVYMIWGLIDGWGFHERRMVKYLISCIAMKIEWSLCCKDSSLIEWFNLILMREMQMRFGLHRDWNGNKCLLMIDECDVLFEDESKQIKIAILMAMHNRHSKYLLVECLLFWILMGGLAIKMKDGRRICSLW